MSDATETAVVPTTGVPPPHGARVGPFDVVRTITEGPGATLLEARDGQGRPVLLQVVRLKAARGDAEKEARHQEERRVARRTTELIGEPGFELQAHGGADADDGTRHLFWALPQGSGLPLAVGGDPLDIMTLLRLARGVAARLADRHGRGRFEPLLSEHTVGVGEAGAPRFFAVPVDAADAWLASGQQPPRRAPEELDGAPSRSGDVWRLGQLLSAASARVTLPADAARFVESLCRADPARRPASGAEVLGELDGLLASAPQLMQVPTPLPVLLPHEDVTQSSGPTSSPLPVPEAEDPLAVSSWGDAVWTEAGGKPQTVAAAGIPGVATVDPDAPTRAETAEVPGALAGITDPAVTSSPPGLVDAQTDPSAAPTLRPSAALVSPELATDPAAAHAHPEAGTDQVVPEAADADLEEVDPADVEPLEPEPPDTVILAPADAAAIVRELSAGGVVDRASVEVGAGPASKLAEGRALADAGHDAAALEADATARLATESVVAEGLAASRTGEAEAAGPLASGAAVEAEAVAERPAEAERADRPAAGAEVEAPAPSAVQAEGADAQAGQPAAGSEAEAAVEAERASASAGLPAVGSEAEAAVVEAERSGALDVRSVAGPEAEATGVDGARSGAEAGTEPGFEAERGGAEAGPPAIGSEAEVAVAAERSGAEAGEPAVGAEAGRSGTRAGQPAAGPEATAGSAADAEVSSAQAGEPAAGPEVQVQATDRAPEAERAGARVGQPAADSKAEATAADADLSDTPEHEARAALGRSAQHVPGAEAVPAASPTAEPSDADAEQPAASSRDEVAALTPEEGSDDAAGQPASLAGGGSAPGAEVSAGGLEAAALESDAGAHGLADEADAPSPDGEPRGASVPLAGADAAHAVPPARTDMLAASALAAAESAAAADDETTLPEGTPRDLDELDAADTLTDDHPASAVLMRTTAEVDEPQPEDRLAIDAIAAGWEQPVLPAGESPWSEVVSPRGTHRRDYAEFPGFDEDLPRGSNPPAAAPPAAVEYVQDDPSEPSVADVAAAVSGFDTRKVAGGFLAVLVILGLFALIARSGGRDTSAAADVALPAQEFVLESRPAAAWVVAEADGRVLGKTPLAFLVPAGSHPQVFLVAPGHEPMRMELMERGGVEARLVPTGETGCTVTLSSPDGVQVTAFDDTPVPMGETPVQGALLVRAAADQEQQGARLVTCPERGGAAKASLHFNPHWAGAPIRITEPAGVAAYVNGDPVGRVPTTGHVDRAFVEVRVDDAEGMSESRWVPTRGPLEVRMPTPKPRRRPVLVVPDNRPEDADANVEISGPVAPAAPTGRVERLLKAGHKHLKAGRSRKASQAFRECLRIAPNEPTCTEGLGLLYRRIGKADKARVYFTRFLELVPSGPDAERVRGYLAE